LLAACRDHLNLTNPSIDPNAWDSSRFKPVPPIIEAAVALYSDIKRI